MNALERSEITRQSAIAEVSKGTYNTLQMSDAEWQAATEMLIRGLGPGARVVRDDYQSQHFGNRIFEIETGDIAFRLIRDRGTLMIMVGSGGRWHSASAAISFYYERATADERHPDVRVLDLIALNRSFSAILSSPRFADYEEAVSRAAFERIATTNPFAAVI